MKIIKLPKRFSSSLSIHPWLGVLLLFTTLATPLSVIAQTKEFWSNDSFPYISGSAQPHKRVAVLVNNYWLGETSADQSGSWKLSPRFPLADSTYQVHAYAIDQERQLSPLSEPVLLTVDTKVPKADVTSLSYTSGQGVSVSGTAERNTTVQLYSGTKQLGEVKVDETGLWTFNINALGQEGEIPIRVLFIDEAGNSTQKSTTYHLSPYSPPSMNETVCGEWNSFFQGMYNIMEHVNPTGQPLSIQSTVYSLTGLPEQSLAFTVQAQSQFDLLVHDLNKATVNSYGRVCSSYDTDAGTLGGRMVYYKTNEDGSFDFAFAMPFSQGKQGSQYVTFNSYQPSLDPSHLADSVANWIQITNLSESKEEGVLILHNSLGAEVDRIFVELPAGGRRDIAAHGYDINYSGHAAWIPKSNNALFQVRNVRYYYDSPYTDRQSFVGATQLEGEQGVAGSLSVPLLTSESSAVLEISNISAESVSTSIQIHDSNGRLLADSPILLPPFASYHLIADPILLGRSGTALLQSSVPKSIIVTAMHYGRNQWGGIEYVFSIPAKTVQSEELWGSYNTFLNQGCSLLLTNPSDKAQSVTVDMTRSDGTKILQNHSQLIHPKGLLQYNLCSHEVPNNYGLVRVKSSSGEPIHGSVLRLGENNEYRLAIPLQR